MNTVKDNIKQSKENWWKNNPSYWKNWYRKNRIERAEYIRNKYNLNKLPCINCDVTIEQCNKQCPYEFNTKKGNKK